jgi:hypothetical protein
MIDFAVFGAGQEGRCFLLSHAVALEHDAVGVVDDPAENGVGSCHLATGAWAVIRVDLRR